MKQAVSGSLTLSKRDGRSEMINFFGGVSRGHVNLFESEIEMCAIVYWFAMNRIAPAGAWLFIPKPTSPGNVEEILSEDRG